MILRKEVTKIAAIVPPIRLACIQPISMSAVCTSALSALMRLAAEKKEKYISTSGRGFATAYMIILKKIITMINKPRIDKEKLPNCNKALGKEGIHFEKLLPSASICRVISG